MTVPAQLTLADDLAVATLEAAVATLEAAVAVLLDHLRPPAPSLSGPGWAIPDHNLRPHPPEYHDRSVRAALPAIEQLLTDELARHLYMRAANPSVPEWEAAFDFHTFRMKLRGRRR